MCHFSMLISYVLSERKIGNRKGRSGSLSFSSMILEEREISSFEQKQFMVGLSYRDVPQYSPSRFLLVHTSDMEYSCFRSRVEFFHRGFSPQLRAFTLCVISKRRVVRFEKKHHKRLIKSGEPFSLFSCFCKAPRTYLKILFAKFLPQFRRRGDMRGFPSALSEPPSLSKPVFYFHMDPHPSARHLQI